MIGNILFADHPLAWAGGIGELPIIDREWIGQCPETNIWNKVPAAGSSWQLQGANASRWLKVQPNEVGTKKCRAGNE